MTVKLLMTPRCPMCGSLPRDPLWSLVQLACANPLCDTVMWDPLQDAAAQLADPHLLDLSPDDAPAGPVVAPTATPAPGVGTADDLAGEARLRGLYHRYGYRCASGCPICQVAAVAGREPATVQEWLDAAQELAERVRREDAGGE